MNRDVIVVLGAAVWPEGKPSPSLARRTRHAARLFHEGVAKRLILSGGVKRHSPAEAVVMREIALREGVPLGSIILDDRARNTIATARNCAAIMTQQGMRTAVVVTDGFHMPRALLIFRWLGIEATGSAPARARRQAPSASLMAHSLREIIAAPWTVLRLLTRFKSDRS